MKQYLKHPQSPSRIINSHKRNKVCRNFSLQLVKNDNDKVLSIETRKEKRTEHIYLILLMEGGENIKIDFSVGGATLKEDSDINNKYGYLVRKYQMPQHIITRAFVHKCFFDKKAEYEGMFSIGLCGNLADNFAIQLGAQRENDVELDFM